MDKPHNTQNKQLENLLQVTAQRMGTTPEDLKTVAAGGLHKVSKQGSFSKSHDSLLFII